MQEKALKRLCFSKFSGEAYPRTPLEVSSPLARVGQIHVCPPHELARNVEFALSFQVVKEPVEEPVFLTALSTQEMLVGYIIIL